MGQPLKLPVSYWNQSTDSVTGMTGTSFSMTACSWFTIECCVAVDVVVGYWLISASVAGLLYRSKLDPAAVPILAELAEATRLRAAELGRRFHLIAESDLNDARLIRPSAAEPLPLLRQRKSQLPPDAREHCHGDDSS